MDINRVNFESLPNGGDDVTGALVKLDHNVQELADAVTDGDTAATALTTRVDAVENKATDLDTRVTAARSVADTAKTTADAAKTAASTADGKAVAAQGAATSAQTTANAALPKTGPSTTPGLQLRSGLPPSIAAIEATNNSTNLALNVTNGGNGSASAVMSFLLEGVFRGYFGIDTDAKWKVGNGDNAYVIWHQGNTTVDANNFIKKVLRGSPGTRHKKGAVTPARCLCDQTFCREPLPWKSLTVPSLSGRASLCAM